MIEAASRNLESGRIEHTGRALEQVNWTLPKNSILYRWPTWV